MEKNKMIRKTLNTSLVLLISAFHGGSGMEEEKATLSNQTRTEVHRVLEKFQRNMNAYYERTGNLKRISITPSMSSTAPAVKREKQAEAQEDRRELLKKLINATLLENKNIAHKSVKLKEKVERNLNYKKGETIDDPLYKQNDLEDIWEELKQKYPKFQDVPTALQALKRYIRLYSSSSENAGINPEYAYQIRKFFFRDEALIDTREQIDQEQKEAEEEAKRQKELVEDRVEALAAGQEKDLITQLGLDESATPQEIKDALYLRWLLKVDKPTRDQIDILNKLKYLGLRHPNKGQFYAAMEMSEGQRDIVMLSVLRLAKNYYRARHHLKKELNRDEPDKDQIIEWLRLYYANFSYYTAYYTYPTLAKVNEGLRLNQVIKELNPAGFLATLDEIREGLRLAKEGVATPDIFMIKESFRLKKKGITDIRLIQEGTEKLYSDLERWKTANKGKVEKIKDDSVIQLNFILGKWPTIDEYQLYATALRNSSISPNNINAHMIEVGLELLKLGFTGGVTEFQVEAYDALLNDLKSMEEKELREQGKSLDEIKAATIKKEEIERKITPEKIKEKMAYIALEGQKLTREELEDGGNRLLKYIPQKHSSSDAKLAVKHFKQNYAFRKSLGGPQAIKKLEEIWKNIFEGFPDHYTYMFNENESRALLLLDKIPMEINMGIFKVIQRLLQEEKKPEEIKDIFEIRKKLGELGFEGDRTDFQVEAYQEAFQKLSEKDSENKITKSMVENKMLEIAFKEQNLGEDEKSSLKEKILKTETATVARKIVSEFQEKKKVQAILDQVKDVYEKASHREIKALLKKGKGLEAIRDIFESKQKLMRLGFDKPTYFQVDAYQVLLKRKNENEINKEMVENTMIKFAFAPEQAAMKVEGELRNKILNALDVKDAQNIIHDFLAGQAGGS